MALNPAQLKAAEPYTLFPTPDHKAFWAAAKDSSKAAAYKGLKFKPGTLFRTKCKLKAAWEYFMVRETGGFQVKTAEDFAAFVDKSVPPAVTAAKTEKKPAAKKSDVKKDEKPAAKVETKKEATKAEVKKDDKKSDKKKSVAKVDKTKYSYSASSGVEAPAGVIEAFERLVRSSGPKVNGTLGQRLRDAKLLVVAKQGETIVGCMGLMQKPEDYITTINAKAKAKLSKTALELLWVRIDTNAVVESERDTVLKGMYEALKLGKASRDTIASKEIFAVYNTNEATGNGYMATLKLTKHERTHSGLVREAQLYLAA